MRRIIVFLLFLTIISCASLRRTGPTTLSIASWNIRTLSDMRSEFEIKAIANIIKRYDLVAIQEVKDTSVLTLISNELKAYNYIVSQKSKGWYGERYAFFYKRDIVKVLGEGYIVEEEASNFIRPSFAASFKSGNFDFVLVTTHILWGKSKNARRKEISLLDEVVLFVEEKEFPERDIILLGDFNMDCDDKSWQLSGYKALVDSKTGTTIYDNTYDNIWINSEYTLEYVGRSGVFKYDEVLYTNNDKAISYTISDHRPVFAYFYRNTKDDDF